jgi:adenosylmethionine-8-amino-7-oxononanoate aminotransferase
MCTAKGLTSGYLPLGAVFVRDALVETLNSVGYLAHGFTYSGHPAACAAALANLRVITEQKLPQYVRDTIGQPLRLGDEHLVGHLPDLRGLQTAPVSGSCSIACLSSVSVAVRRPPRPPCAAR